MDKTIFLKNGKIVEDKFKELFSNSSEANKTENIYEHWDIKIPIKVDVKGLKKINRNEEKPNENFHWIEIKGITGKKGWLYGDADYFAFETELYFIIVEKTNLQNWILQNVKNKYFEQPVRNNLYKRNGNEDVLTLIKTIDLCFLSTAIILKNDKTN